MKQIKTFFVWLKNIVKAVIAWVWNIITRVFQYLLESSFKLVFWVWGMVLLTIFVLTGSLSLLMFASASYSSTPQALILINKLKPSIERMADFAGIQINKSLDRYEEREKRWEEKRAEWEMKKGENK